MSAPWRISGAMLLAACGGANAGQSDPQPCSPVEMKASTVDASGLKGKYAITLVATSGDKRGSKAAGRMELMPQQAGYQKLERPDGMQDTTFTMPLYGTAEADFAAVGAVAPGDAGSTDPAKPGVLVMQAPGRVMLRVGSEANRRDVRRFDGAYTVLEVQQVTDQGFVGTWRSGVGTQQAGGHFCANKT